MVRKTVAGEMCIRDSCTEEVFPGFKFSVCSYVVSLLRPEIIRDLDLPRHGLEILPLDGTFTPMPNGDHLWRVNDHGLTHREIARHSRVDAEAYDEFGKAMQAMCRFVKMCIRDRLSTLCLRW